MLAEARYKERSWNGKTPSSGSEIPCPVSLASHKDHQLYALVWDSSRVGSGSTGAGVTSSEAVTRSTLP